MKKVFLLLFVLISFCAMDATAENLLTLRSEHFEFIYPIESEETAIILYENAESLYEKATSLLHTDINIFLPVYITPNTQELNAYYTAYPYNRIVFYDTPPDSFSLAVFSNTKVSVFYHELVHALTMNMKNGFWNFLSTLLGDVYSPSFLYSSTLSFLEGATVSFESMDGEGRLNNGDSLAYLVQAKLEDFFPSWKDASGPRDIFPKAQCAYLFGGAFSRYIQQKYGMEKYSEFWVLCGSGNPFVDISFKKIYGVSLKEEWNEFKESIPVPVLADNVDVVPVAGKPSYSSAMAFRNGKEKGIAYIDNGSFILYAPVDENTGVPGKTRKLLLADGYVSDLSFSDDGRYLLITGIGTNLANAYSLKIYDMEKDAYVSTGIYPLSYSCIADFPEYGKFVVGVAVRSGRAYLEIRSFDDVLERGGDAEVLCSERFPVQREVYGLCPDGEKVWSLEKDAGVWRVVAYEFIVKDNRCSLERQSSYGFPHGIVPSSFAYGGTNEGTHTFYFAVAGEGLSAGYEEEPGSLSRLLTLEVPSAMPGARVSLSKGDVSGGVHRPFYDISTETLYFIARKSESVDVSYCHGIPGGLCELSPIYVTLAEKSPEIGNLQETETPQEVSQPELPTERGTYNPLRYVFRGSFIPAGMDLTTDDIYLVGGTLGFLDPTESFKMLVSGGWDFINNKGGVGLRTWGGPSFLSYNASLHAEWNKNGFSKAKGKLTLSGTIPVNTRRQEIQYSNDTLYTFTNTVSCIQIVQNLADISYVSSFKTGRSVYDLLSLSAGVSCVTECGFGIGFPPVLINNVGFHVSAGVGGLFPISVQASVSCSSSTFLRLSGDIVLFSTEIQKGVPLLPFYANRFTLTGGYTATWQDYPRSMMILDFPNLIANLSDLYVKHGVKCGANFTLSPIFSLTYNAKFEVGADFTWYFGNEQDNKLYDLVICGVFTF